MVKKILLLTTTFIFSVYSIEAQTIRTIKKELQQSIEKHETELIKTSDAIWEAAETALLEFESSKILINHAKKTDLILTKELLE